MTDAERTAKLREEFERLRRLREQRQRNQPTHPAVKARPISMHWFRNR